MPGGPWQGRKPRYGMLSFREPFPGHSEKAATGATWLGFPQDDVGQGYIRGIISCLVGFVRGKQSCIGLLQANVFYRGYLIYAYTYTFATFPSYFCFHNDVRAGIASLTCAFLFRSPWPIGKLYFSRSIAICFQSRELRTSTHSAWHRVHSSRELSVARMVHLRCISLHGSREYPDNLALFEHNVIVQVIMRGISICDRNVTDWSICQRKLPNKTMAFGEVRLSLFLPFKTSNATLRYIRSRTTGG